MFHKSRNKREDVAHVILNGNPLPWVEEINHLGNILQSDNSMSKDCLMKRGKFIGKVNTLLQELYFVNSSVMMKLLNIYATSFYGSCLWNLYSKEVSKLFASWNVSVRNIFRLPRDTHRYLIEVVSNSRHPKTMMCSRYINFTESLSRCKKRCVRNLYYLVKDDRRTLTGRTLSKIAYDCGVSRNSLCNTSVKKMKYWSVPPEEQWRTSFLLELLDIRSNHREVANFDAEEIDELIGFICSR